MSELNSEAKTLLASARRAELSPGPVRRARLRNAVLAGVATWSTVAAASMTLTKVALACLVSATLGSGLTFAVMKRPLEVARLSPPAVTVPPPPVTPLTVVEPLAARVEPQRFAEKVSRRNEPPPPAETGAEAEGEGDPEQEAEVAPPANVKVSLQEELAVLDQALSAIDKQEWTAADSALDQYRQRFPGGALEYEAAALQVLARCGQGRVDEAKALALSLEQSAPMNPSVQRLQSSCVREAR